MFKQKSPQKTLENCVSQLKNELGENLYSCIVYGSMVRGHFVQKLSDINLLIILKESTPQAHLTIGNIIRANRPVDPMTVGLKGIERTMQVFGLKFASIKRNYKILSGDDPFVKFKLDTSLDKFLCEQSIRNIRLRLVHNFIMFGDNRKRFSFYLEDIISTVFTDISEVARLNGVQLPQDFKERIPMLEKTFDLKLDVLSDLLDHKDHFVKLKEADIVNFQSRIFQMLNHVVFWIESKWELPVPAQKA